MKTKLEGKRVIITDKESIFFDDWGIVDSYDGEYYYIRIADGRGSLPIFARNEFRVPRKNNERDPEQ